MTMTAVLAFVGGMLAGIVATYAPWLARKKEDPPRPPVPTFPFRISSVMIDDGFQIASVDPPPRPIPSPRRRDR